VTLVYNPKSGGAGRLNADELLVLIREAGHTAVAQASKEEDWEEVLGEPTDLVAVAGGDGAVGKVARHVLGRPVPLTVLPTGTANNVATTLGLTDVPLDRLIAGWATARRARFDVGVARGPWGTTPFIEGFGVGLFAEAMSRLGDSDSPERARLDRESDKVTSAQVMLRERLRRGPAMELTVEFDGRDLSGEYVLLEAMNIRHVGPNLELAPDADPGDGLLDVVLLRHGERGALSEYLSHCRDGTPTPPGLTVHRGTRLRLRWDGFDVHIDDEPWPGGGTEPSTTPVSIDVTLGSHSIEFLVPMQRRGTPGNGFTPPERGA
jgi:diacylglycerol kinase family enzyme